MVGAKVDADFREKLKELGFDKHDIIVSSQTYSFMNYTNNFVEVVRANFNSGWQVGPTRSIYSVNEEDTTKYWVCEGYYWEFKNKYYTY